MATLTENQKNAINAYVAARITALLNARDSDVMTDILEVQEHRGEGDWLAAEKRSQQAALATRLNTLKEEIETYIDTLDTQED